ncbi:TolC family protein [Rhodovarius lipocyclicus]|uniref:TolC family protein n=1 Tax=Rhodovarius lipocyclicus TaxID=268410 RepID=UPI001358D02C|nr:TolC family protein [Rhodovarius lipocyclicus]
MRPALIGALALLLAAPFSARAMTLAEAVEAAMARAPEGRALGAERLSQQAQREAANRLFPGAPYLQLDTSSDRPGTHRGFATYGQELGTPLWLPGEGTATGRRADAGMAEVDARQTELRLAVAGLVREAVGNLDEAKLAIPVLQRRLQAARQLQGIAERRAARGEAAPTDALLAQSETALAEAALAEPRTLAAQARARLEGLTGQPLPEDARAPSLAEERPSPARPLAEHPRLLGAERAVETARAALALVEASRRESPVLALQTRQEQAGAGQGFDSRVGVLVRIPFATEGRNRPRRAAAEADLARAEAQRALAEREITTGLRQARLALDAAVNQRRLADTAFRALDARRGQLERGFAAGEFPLVELLRARLAAHDAELARARAEAARRRALAQLNQIAGQWP